MTDGGNHANAVEIIRLRVLNARLFLAQHHNLLPFFVCLFHHLLRALATQNDGHQRTGEDHAVTKRKNLKGFGWGFCKRGRKEVVYQFFVVCHVVISQKVRKIT